MPGTTVISLEPALTYTVRTTLPLTPTRVASGARVQSWQLSEAALAGPSVQARLAATGSDWMTMSDDGFWRPDVRVQFETEDGTVILMRYRGLVEQTDRFKAAAEGDESTAFSDQYMRLMIEFAVDHPRYRWLTTSLFVGAGRLLGTGHIEYAVYRVT